MSREIKKKQLIKKIIKRIQKGTGMEGDGGCSLETISCGETPQVLLSGAPLNSIPNVHFATYRIMFCQFKILA